MFISYTLREFSWLLLPLYVLIKNIFVIFTNVFAVPAAVVPRRHVITPYTYGLKFPAPGFQLGINVFYQGSRGGSSFCQAVLSVYHIKLQACFLQLLVESLFCTDKTVGLEFRV